MTIAQFNRICNPRVDHVDAPKTPAAITESPAAGSGDPVDPAAAINTAFLRALRMLKDSLKRTLEVGELLQQDRQRRGDEDHERVEPTHAIGRADTERLVRFHEQYHQRKPQLSPAAVMTFSEVAELLGNLRDCHGQDPSDDSSCSATKSARPRSKAGKTEAKLKAASTQPVQAAPPIEQPSEANAKPACDPANEQAELTAEQKKLLVRRSPKLLLSVRVGKLTAEEAVRIAEKLPDRAPLQQPASP